MKKKLLLLYFLAATFFANAQNVGIGTTTPVQKLHVEGTTYLNGNVGIGISSPLDPLHVNGVSLFTPGGSNIQILDGNKIQAYLNGGLNLTTFSDDPIKFTTFTSGGGGGGERMRILSNGNVGIGTSSPLQKLHVEGTTYLNGNVGIGTSSPLDPLHVNGASLFTPGGSNIQILDGNKIQAYANGGLNLTTYSDDPIKFTTYTSGGGSGGERMRILSNGNVGIGTSTPLQKLHVEGTTYLNGNVGIGTTAPAASLEVNGYTKLGSNAPSIKVKKLTGTTAATEGSSVTIAHGLNASKILSVSVIVNYVPGSFVAPHDVLSIGYQFQWDDSGGNLVVTNIFGASANILSKPITILITYEE